MPRQREGRTGQQSNSTRNQGDHQYWNANGLVPRRPLFRQRQRNHRLIGNNRNRRGRQRQHSTRDSTGRPNPPVSTRLNGNDDSGDEDPLGEDSDREPGVQSRGRTGSVFCGRFVQDARHERFHKEAYALLEHGTKIQEKLASYVQHVHNFAHIEEGMMDWDHECPVVRSGNGSNSSDGTVANPANSWSSTDSGVQELIRALSCRVEVLEGCQLVSALTAQPCTVNTPNELPNGYARADQQQQQHQQHHHHQYQHQNQANDGVGSQQQLKPHTSLYQQQRQQRQQQSQPAPSEGQLSCNTDNTSRHHQSRHSDSRGNVNSTSRKRSLQPPPPPPIQGLIALGDVFQHQPILPFSTVGTHGPVAGGMPSQSSDGIGSNAGVAGIPSALDIAAYENGSGSGAAVGATNDGQNAQNLLYRDPVTVNPLEQFDM